MEADGSGRKVMRNDKIWILATFVVIVGAAVGIQRFQYLRDGQGRAGGGTAYVPHQPLKPADVGQMRGFSLQLQSASPKHPYELFIREIAQTGANAICFVVAAYQENCESTSIFIENRRIPSDNRVKELVAFAKEQGLRVVLMPIVLLENPRAGEWRGKISPRNWDDWWEDYENYVLHYAQIAQAAGAEIFMVGSELVSTEKDHADRWRDLIRRARGVFKGYLSYSANWDHYRPVSWWRDVDIIGMTTYYDLTEGQKPTVERLLASWRPIRKEVLDWQREIGRPILFTEVGWPNQITCAQYPWDYTRNPDKPDPQAQANCFDAFFQTWIREKPVAGFLVWEWRNYLRDFGPEDTGYTPCGKPALDVIRKFYQRPDPNGRNGRDAPTTPRPDLPSPATTPTAPEPQPPAVR